MLSEGNAPRLSLPSITKTPNGFLRFDTHSLPQSTLGGGTVDATDVIRSGVTRVWVRIPPALSKSGPKSEINSAPSCTRRRATDPLVRDSTAQLRGTLCGPAGRSPGKTRQREFLLAGRVPHVQESEVSEDCSDLRISSQGLERVAALAQHLATALKNAPCGLTRIKRCARVRMSALDSLQVLRRERR